MQEDVFGEENSRRLAWSGGRATGCDNDLTSGLISGASRCSDGYEFPERYPDFGWLTHSRKVE